LTATVFYPYHPFSGQTFNVMQRSGGKSGRLILELPNSHTLAIPQWMLEPQAAQLQVGSDVHVDHHSLLSIIALLKENCSAPNTLTDVLECHDGPTQL
jgi:hypothetical protein